MNSNININLRSIEAFKSISERGLATIEDQFELVNYSLGFPICNKDTIPDKILIILSGEARLLDGTTTRCSTISKLKSDSFIGLSSFLKAKGCELVSASSDLLCLALSDKIILELYKEESTFRHWCNTHIQKADILAIAKTLDAKIAKNPLTIKDLVDTLSGNVQLNSVNNQETIKKDNIEDYVNMIGSSNFEGKQAGEIVDYNQMLTLRGPLSGRIYQILTSTYNQILNTNPENNKETINYTESVDSPNKEIKHNDNMLGESSKNLGQYKPQKEFKLIKGNGVMRESIACLQMLAIELNLPYRIDAIEKILRDTIRRNKKPTIEILGGITSMLGLHTSAAKIEPKMGGRLPSPSIISWGDSFALVKESNSNFLEIVSPKDGIIQIKPEQFNESFEKGFIEILLVEKNEQTPESKFGIQWLWPSIKRHRGVLLQVLLASFVVQLFGLANPLMIQIIIDKVISQRSLDTLQVLGVAIVVITIIGGVLSSLRTFLFQETTNRIDTRLGAEVIDHLLRLPLNYFDKRPVGELGSRIAELEKIRDFLTGQALTTILDAAFALIYIVVMVVYSWLLTLIALGVVPIQIMLTVLGTPLIRRQVREVAKENATTQSHLVEVLTGIQTVKAQNIERVSRWKWQDLYSKYISRSFEKTITGTALGETSKVLQQLSQLLVLWIGATLVLKGELSLGQLIAFRIISGYVTQPLLRLSSIWQNIQELRVSFERLADIIDTPEEAPESDKAKIPLPSINGSVKLEDVSFSFKIGQPEILKKINLEINQGQFVGVVGQSGSGKSTLMKLLPRLYKPSSGRLMIDGYDVNKVELYSLRRQIGIVPQEPLLFAGSINDNIALTDPEAPSDDIVKVAKIADAHDFIMNLSDGYSTNVGERGAGLSGGQKQRIAIARTLLNNPKLLIMDEATSALDYETERKVCNGIKDSCQESTVFFITHRLSTVKNADIIIMLHEGSIVETGSHEELMNMKGRYFALYRQQESI